MSRIGAFESIAGDLGILRYTGESDLGFCCRTAYSAARFWASAYCMDDGQGGQVGLSRQGLSRRLRRWVATLDSIAPGVSDWFKLEDNGIACVVGRLLDAGDVLPAGEGGHCIARTPRLQPLASDAAFALGFFEPATAAWPNGSIMSGLATLVPCDCAAPEPRAPWWETDLPYMAWAVVSSYGELEYADPRSSHWGVSSSDVWGGSELGKQRLQLARYVDAGTNKPHYLAVRVTGRRALASRIDASEAQQLLNHLKRAGGNPVCIPARSLDVKHVEAFVPISVLPAQISAAVDLLSWPKNDVEDRRNRIFRVEAFEVVKELLAPYEIETRLVKVKG